MHISPTSKRKSTFAGEPWGSYLAEWLNGCRPFVDARYVGQPQEYNRQPTTIELKRVNKLVELISDVESQLANSVSRGASSKLPLSGPMGDSKVRRAAEKLDKALERYRFKPRLRFRPFRDYRVTKNVFRFHLRVGYQGASSEDLAVQCLLSVLDEGCFDHLQRCRQCSKWFFAHFEHHKFCKSRCEKQYREQSPEYKAYHREVARRSYKNRRDGIGGWRKNFSKR